ncbi:Txe/YoeB family addiction module toxin [Mucilaginibacter gotjawali]|uniref:Putative mRNA interferase YoeB n=1 Tax=Mucilaginibacter gotjawali TaxID=1550579 RepID=A0A839SA05_9SPHI|nr:Txe/YoeB family addiction module toxin [Mucilaginibacter gotjawali]MBB3054835.1 toxin YoeB [Mucilaginibacter gotjawali]
MEIIYSDEALKDIEYWKKSGNKIVQRKIQQLLDAIEEDPFEGIGKPEPLRHNLSGLWSRRINHSHRIIYQLTENGQTIKIHSLKGHYD